MAAADCSQKWGIGDVFAVPLKDGSRALGQIVGQEPSVLNSVSCAFFDVPLQTLDESCWKDALSAQSLISILFVTRELLDNETWQLIGSHSIAIPLELRPFEHLRTKGFVGAKVIGAGNVTKFLNAFYGLHPWDAWHDPAYLDKLLVSPSKKPKNVVYAKQQL